MLVAWTQVVQEERPLTKTVVAVRRTPAGRGAAVERKRWLRRCRMQEHLHRNYQEVAEVGRGRKDKAEAVEVVQMASYPMELPCSP